MKFLRGILHYICKTSEEPGIWTEKMICDILDLRFNSKRSYLQTENYPNDLKRDIRETLMDLIPQIKISKHMGHHNDYYDFMNMSNETVSIKTNITGNKICSQYIGQTSLQNFNKKTGYHFKTVNAYKSYILKNTHEMLNLYLKYLFCCDHTLSFRYERGEIVYLKKIKSERSERSEAEEAEVKSERGEAEVKRVKSEAEEADLEDTTLTTLQNDVKIVCTQTLKTWNESMTAKVLIDDVYKPLAEFQIHNNRNCIKCRFNLDTVVTLIEKGLIKNIDLKTLKLRYMYNIKVIREENEIEITASTTNKKRKRTNEE